MNWAFKPSTSHVFFLHFGRVYSYVYTSSSSSSSPVFCLGDSFYYVPFDFEFEFDSAYILYVSTLDLNTWMKNK